MDAAFKWSSLLTLDFRGNIPPEAKVRDGWRWKEKRRDGGCSGRRAGRQEKPFPATRPNRCRFSVGQTLRRRAVPVQPGRWIGEGKMYHDSVVEISHGTIGKET